MLLHNWKLVPCATTKSAYYFSWRAHNEVISQEMQYLEGWWASPGKTGWQQPPGRPPSPFSFRSPDLQSSIIPWRPGLTWPHSISYRLSAAKHAMNHRRYGRCYVYLINYRFPLPSFFYLFIFLYFAEYWVKSGNSFVNKWNLWHLRLLRGLTLWKTSALLLSREYLIWALIIYFFLEEQVAFG